MRCQKKSYQWFIEQGLKEVFDDVAYISDYAGNLVLKFIDYKMEDTPKYTVMECKERDATYAAPLQGARCRLINQETEEVKEQEIFMGDFPLMTEQRHLRHQRRGARHRFPAGAFPRRVL